jgi:hypothetical protein
LELSGDLVGDGGSLGERGGRRDFYRGEREEGWRETKTRPGGAGRGDDKTEGDWKMEGRCRRQAGGNNKSRKGEKDEWMMTQNFCAWRADPILPEMLVYLVGVFLTKKILT